MTSSSDRTQPVDVGALPRTELVRRLFPSINFELAQIAAALSIESATASRWRARPTPDLEEADKAERRAIAHIARAADLMRDVAALGGPFSGRVSEVSVPELIGQAIALSRHALYQANASVAVSPSSDLAAVQADRGLALQILLELLLDAVAGLNPIDDHAVIAIGARRDGTVIHISVSNATAAGEPLRAPRPDLAKIALRAGGRLDPTAPGGPAFVLSFPIVCNHAAVPGDRAERRFSLGAQSARSRA